MATRIPIALAAAAVLAAGAVFGQRGPPLDDVPPPPRLEAGDAVPAAEVAPARGSLERPQAARLAPLPVDAAGIEEVIVVADPALRLPDLGTDLRLEREAQEAREARIQVSFLPPPQPIDPLTDPATLRVDYPESRRAGYIQLFRLRFGQRRD